MGTYRHLNFHARIGPTTENLFDNARGHMTLTRLLGNFQQDILAFSRHQWPWLDNNFPADTRIFRHNECRARLHVVTTYNLRRISFDHFNQLTFPTPAMV